MKFGLIGKDVRNSFSKQIHETLGYDYELRSIKEEDLDSFLQLKDFKGINVTIPYKEKVLKHLDYISPSVSKIGVCNCIVNKNSELHGYNTDYDGVKYLIERNGFNLENKRVLILGTGGTCKTVSTVLKDMNVKEIYVASRNPKNNQVSYEYAQKLDVDYIINTTPNGMVGYSDDELVSLSNYPKLEGVIDVIYNPLRTSLLYQAKKYRIPYSNGLSMLIYQAIRASELFNDSIIDDDKVKAIYNSIYQSKMNVVLIGMPGAGKSTLGRLLAKELNKQLVDMDEQIVREENKEIKEIFAINGEQYFRNKEKELCKTLSFENNLIISTGGGVILNEENIINLSKNGIVIFLNKDIEKISITNDRPLTKSKEDLVKLYNERYELYQRYSDIEIQVSNDILKDIEIIKESLYEIINR